MRLFGITLLVCALLTGCTDNTSTVHPSDLTQTDGGETATARTSGVTFVCVGMEESARFGSCPGCLLDSNRMFAFLKNQMGYGGYLLQSKYATREAVTTYLKKAVAETPSTGLFIFYYSGHGGQEQLTGWGTSEPDGADGEDEYLCLYDSYLLDDEIWEIIAPCKGRIFMIFDACHSQTMYRSVVGDIARDRGLAVPLEESLVKSRGFTLRPKAIPLEENVFNMLCWSGCLEKEYSYGSSAGGFLTNALFDSWKTGIGYVELWVATTNKVQKAQPTQHPCSTLYGRGFEEAFR